MILRPIITSIIALSVALLFPTFSHAASPSGSAMTARVQQRLAARMAHTPSKPTQVAADSTMSAESLDLSSLKNLRNDLLSRFRSSSSASSVSTSSSRVSSSSSSRSSQSSSRVSSVSSRSSSSVAQNPSGTLAQQVLTLLNQERSKAGLPALTSNSLLEKAAAGHAQDMNANSYFDHYSRDGRSPTERIRGAGYPNVPSCNCSRQYYYGENIARGQTTAIQVMNDWMNSPGHRANILSKDFREIGIAISGTYWVQDFGGVWDR